MANMENKRITALPIVIMPQVWQDLLENVAVLVAMNLEKDSILVYRVINLNLGNQK